MSTRQGSNITVERACQLAGVNRASYYRAWQADAPAEHDTALRDAIQRLALADRHCGYRRIQQQLRREGIEANHKRVLRLMREDNLLSLRRRSFVITTDSQHIWPVYPNLVRGIQTTDINQLWVADITYIKLREEFVFVAVVLDAHSRRVIGWNLDRQLRAEIAMAALRQAIAERPISPGLIHHSDRGVQYACSDYTDILHGCGMQISMSRVGNPYDNAKAESFMKTLKYEQINATEYRTLEELRESLEQFIERYYNAERLHSSLGYLSPIEFEAALSGTPQKRRLSFLRHQEIYRSDV